MKKIALVLSVAALMLACNNRKHGNGYIQPVQESHNEHGDHGHADAHSDKDSHAKEDGHGHADAHSEADGHAHADAHSEADGHGHADAHSQAEGTVDATGNFVSNVGGLLDLELAEGGKLHVGENSTENKLYKQLSDAHFAVNEDKTKGWVSLDRTFFESGKSTLTAESSAQLKNIAAILKAYPEATIKIGGYTDNTGSAEVNTKVSGERANIVSQQLAGLGVDASRLKTEGYGPLHPTCEANDTDICKAQNRRVEIRVTKK